MPKTKQSPLEVYLRQKAKEFKSDWEDVPMWIIDEANKFIEQSKPTKKEQMIAKAADLLCGSTYYKTEDKGDDDTLSVEEMVALIAEHEDEHEIIDNIDGVVVWEKIEYSFTCKQFCQHIDFDDSFYE